MNPVKSSIEERTRWLLGWRNTPSCSSPSSASSSCSSISYSSSSSTKVFGRKRRQSVSSSSSSEYSDNSPYAASFSSSPAPRKSSCPEGALLTRLRALLHDLPADGTAYQRLLDGVTSAMEEKDDNSIAMKRPKTEMTSQPQSPIESERNDDFPSDLMSVDVSAFASLIMYHSPV